MDALTKLYVSLYLIKKSNETCIDDGQPAKVKNWDTIKGIPEGNTNQDYTNILIPNREGQPIDIGYNNKQNISGTGYGALILGKYRNE